MQQERQQTRRSQQSASPGQRIRNVSRTLVVSMTPIIRAGLAMIASCCTIMSCIISVPRSVASRPARSARCRNRSEKNCSSMISTKQKAASLKRRDWLLVAQQMPDPQSQIEPLGLAEQHVFALELVDGPPQGQRAVAERRDQHGADVHVQGAGVQRATSSSPFSSSAAPTTGSTL